MRRLFLTVTLIWLAGCAPPEYTEPVPDGGIGGTGAPVVD